MAGPVATCRRQGDGIDVHRRPVGVRGEGSGESGFEGETGVRGQSVGHGRPPSAGFELGAQAVQESVEAAAYARRGDTQLASGSRRSPCRPQRRKVRSIRSSGLMARRACSRSMTRMASAGSPSPRRSWATARSTTVSRRFRRTAWRASLAAMATSQDRTCSGCRRPDSRRQAMAQADLEGVPRGLHVAADDVRHAGHGHVVLGHQLGEGGLITASCQADRGIDRGDVLHCDVRHGR